MHTVILSSLGECDLVATVSRSVNTTACSFDYSPYYPHQWEAAQPVAVSQVPDAAASSQVALEIHFRCIAVFIATAEALLSTWFLHPLLALSFHREDLKLL